MLTSPPVFAHKFYKSTPTEMRCLNTGFFSGYFYELLRILVAYRYDQAAADGELIYENFGNLWCTGRNDNSIKRAFI